MTEGYSIEAEGLTKRYGDFIAVEDLSFKVRKGEFMGLLGPNGAGKSTTLKMIAGLIWPTEGRVLIDGTDIKRHREAMSRVGAVIETPEFYSSFTPSEAMQYTGRIYGLSEVEIAVRARDVLEEVKMWDWRNKKIGQFSKGMRQRVVLAQAMLPNPDILILDEPTSGLDPRGMIEMREVLSELNKRHRAILISTHMLKEVSELCESVTMIRGGKQIASGDVNVLINDYVGRNSGRVEIRIRTEKEMTAEFVAEISSASGVREAERMGDYEIRLRFIGRISEQAALADVVMRHRLGLVSMNEQGMDIEKLYMELTEGEVSVK